MTTLYLPLVIVIFCTSSAFENVVGLSAREGYFNTTSYVNLYPPLKLNRHIGLSFRSCTGGQLFNQRSQRYSMILEVRAEGLFFTVSLSKRYETKISANLLDNQWHNVNILNRLGNLTISSSGHLQTIANSTYNSEILTQPELATDKDTLIVGSGFDGCILEGPSVVFGNNSQLQSHNVEWGGTCPLPAASCGANHCEPDPCTHGTCKSFPDRFVCICPPRYFGTKCQYDSGPPCDKHPCVNGGTCSEDLEGDYSCFCPIGFSGKDCDIKLTAKLCENNVPCQNNGSCFSTGSSYRCVCPAGFTGKDCEHNIDECQSGPCQNGGSCEDGINNYTCLCGRTGYTGPNCEININECENNPCLNNGICFDNYGGYTCQCVSGFGGQNCEQKLSECTPNPCTAPNTMCKSVNNSHVCVCKPGYTGTAPNCVKTDNCASMPCANGGSCRPITNSYVCMCPPGYSGKMCDIEPCGPCENNGVYMQTGDGYFCRCKPGYSGKNCSYPVSCIAYPCRHATACFDFPGGYYCACQFGWSGRNCDRSSSGGDCQSSNPCLNGGICTESHSTFVCSCKSGFRGLYCELNIDECMSSPCLNGGTCFDGVNSYLCNCTADFMGINCEQNFDPCANKPCMNNGSCISNVKEYYCECSPGFEGLNCENDIDDCVNKQCPSDQKCVDGINSFECRCSNGFTGPDCSLNVSLCSSNPCRNGATCSESPGNYSCQCSARFTGEYCEQEVDMCKSSPNLCINGICINKREALSGYQCFCTPGFSGDHCEIDFDECLSGPCSNGATCENKVNGFNCVCPPGYSGNICSENIDECLSNPCLNGSTCVDEVATFSCICPPGLTGRRCDIDIDDCSPNPCLNNGLCIDGLNSYTCNCTNTGYEGDHCEINIDECASNPCVNDGKCEDLVNGYECICHPGYDGQNCEIDINECENSPCQHGGTCLEKSNPQNYHPQDKSVPVHFAQPFNYTIAAGYECLCVEGTLGANCETDIDECQSNPCSKRGECKDGLNSYTCLCEEGFEGVHCEIDIDECQRYEPCVHGTCIDKVAGYFCECVGKYGGQNCSVELMGCHKNECLNNGTCKPYLEKETLHKFNCSCPNGFQGHVCEKETTMSLNGSSYVMVNTSREEGYDIQFRFKTTLSDGLLAIGKGSTYYILKLVNGRLNLHSSILNKWEGVFIGSSLNDSSWQKVFVAINSSHLVLAANDEQTIYPINLNEGASASHTSFPTTYLGGAISYLRKFANGQKSFVGCIQDVSINGRWVVPQDTDALSQTFSLVSVEVGCKREAQCHPNPCHSGGHCTDQWLTFSCTCERPFLGTTCQYNYTAATFGHENITDSEVTVNVDPQARKAVRNIMDISMFIRTREPAGGIFSLGSKPSSVNYADETVIAAKLANGELKVSFQFNGILESYGVDGVRLDNGHNHLIQVVRNVTLVQVKINGTEYFRKTISATGHLDLQILQLGATNGVRNFKGVIQDVQMSNGARVMLVEFFPLAAPDVEQPLALGQVSFNKSLVLEGVISDDNCRSEPCMHGGTCSVTWNDFSCACTVGYKGKQCQEMEFCQVQDCPTGSECRNLHHGYECVANITIHDPIKAAPTLQYVFVRGQDKPVDLDNVTLAYRSRTGGSLLQIGPIPDGSFFAISIFYDQVTISWNIGGEREVRNVTNDQLDGDWTTLALRIVGNTISGSLSGAVEDSMPYFTANFSRPHWEQFIHLANVTIGGSELLALDPPGNLLDGVHTNNVEYLHNPGEWSSADNLFKGCIGEVRIGGLLLSYFTPDELNNTNASKDHFELVKGRVPQDQLGCMLCFDVECQNGGKCGNATESYTCACSPGFDGDYCSNNIDECKENDCQNNSTCIDGLAKYTCECQPGWSGPFCTVEIDECLSSPCMNNGTCVDKLARYECICTPEFVGTRCEQLKQVTCENQPCKNHGDCKDVVNPKTQDNFTCSCQNGFVGDYCESPFCEQTPCKNGFCVSQALRAICECQAGFSGKYCEINIDECQSSPCMHGGKCYDGVASYFCNCTGTGYTGDTCNQDVNECEDSTISCNNGDCINTIGSYHCLCNAKQCGVNCSYFNPCALDNPCQNNGECQANCIDRADYVCKCAGSFTGKNCTEEAEFMGARVADIAMIVVPILAIVIIAGFVSLSVFLMMARKKRATRGTYSPSSQEYCNPRVELDNVMKPPPEERLI